MQYVKGKALIRANRVSLLLGGQPIQELERYVELVKWITLTRIPQTSAVAKKGYAYKLTFDYKTPTQARARVNTIFQRLFFAGYAVDFKILQCLTVNPRASRFPGEKQKYMDEADIRRVEWDDGDKKDESIQRDLFTLIQCIEIYNAVRCTETYDAASAQKDFLVATAPVILDMANRKLEDDNRRKELKTVWPKKPYKGILTIGNIATLY